MAHFQSEKEFGLWLKAKGLTQKVEKSVPPDIFVAHKGLTPIAVEIPMAKHVLDIVPMAAPRLNRKSRYSPKKQDLYERYKAYKSELFNLILAYPVYCRISTFPLSLTFVLPMPKSWSQKKKREMLHQLHEQKPDLDNLIKGFQDALMKDDAHIAWYGQMLKVWGYTGKILIH